MLQIYVTALLLKMYVPVPVNLNNLYSDICFKYASNICLSS